MSSTASFAFSRLLTDNPAVDLMARLTYPKKIQVVGLVAGIAILLLTGQLFFSLSGQIERARLERSGLYLVIPIRLILEPLQEHRGLAHAYLSGDEAFRASQGSYLQNLLKSRRIAVDAAIDTAEAAFQTRLPALSQDRRWLEFRQSWRAAARGEDADPRAALDRHNQLVAQLNALISAAADATHLSVDPYVGTFYLAQMVTQNLPAVLEQMARIRDMGTGFYVTRHIDRDDKHLLISLNTMTGTSLTGLRQTIQDKVLPTMPELGDELAPRMAQMDQVAGSVNAFTQMKLMGMLFDSSPSAFFGAMTYPHPTQLSRYGVGPGDTALDRGHRLHRAWGTGRVHDAHHGLLPEQSALPHQPPRPRYPAEPHEPGSQGSAGPARHGRSDRRSSGTQFRRWHGYRLLLGRLPPPATNVCRRPYTTLPATAGRTGSSPVQRRTHGGRLCGHALGLPLVQPAHQAAAGQHRTHLYRRPD